jgi:hypothetical protein
VGTQAQGCNPQTAGIANICDYTSVAASQESLAATATYIRWKLGVHGQPLSGPVTVRSAGGSASRYPAGTNVTLERVIGHRDTGRTSCPGDALYDQLPEIRAMVESGTPFTPVPSARVSAWLADSLLDYGEAVPVTGSLVAPDGTPMAGQAVQVQTNSESRWRTARRLTTGADGSFLTELKPSKRMYVRVRYPGSGDVPGGQSSRMLLRLHPFLSFDRPPRRARRGRAVAVRGNVGPRKRVVQVVFQQSVRGRWRRVGTRAARTRRGSFATSFVAAFRARYRYYAVAKTDLDTDRGVSQIHPLLVR